MANIVVCVELGPGQAAGEPRSPTPASLSAIGAARRVAGAMGATVLALVTMDENRPGGPDEDRLSAALGAVGCDKVLLVTAGGGTGGWEKPLEHIVERFSPRLYLLPAGPLAEAVGPWLAGRTRAFLLPRARLEFRAGTEAVPSSVAACRSSDSGDGPESVDLSAAALPVVVTLEAGPPPSLEGTRPAELAVLETPKQ